MQSAANATAGTDLQPRDHVPAGAASARKGGLLAMPKHVMTPVFALLVSFLAFDVVLIVAPYFLYRATDNVWGSAERMEFLAKAMASGLAFGLVAGIAAERRNHSPWAFVIGHCGFWLACLIAAFDWDLEHARSAPLIVVVAGFLGCIVVLLRTRTPRPSPPPVNGLLKGMCVTTGRCGNIWFGITLMGTIAFAVGLGTIIESMYTARAAQHYVYRSPWFGAVFFMAGLSMLSATFRKWPFRLEQAGWLTVHTGLALVVIGSMTSFLTTVEGEVQIEEGQRVDAFQLSTRTRLGVYEGLDDRAGKHTFEPLIESVADFDLNPAEKEPGRVYAADREALSVTVDRFYGTGAREVVWRDDGSDARAGVVIDLVERDSKKPETIRLDEDGDADLMLPLPGIQFPVSLRRARPRLLDALVREKAPEGHGKILVRDRAGTVLLEMPVNVAAGADTRPLGSPVALTDSAKIPGTEIDVRLRYYFDGADASRGRLMDSSPGHPIQPMVALALAGPEGEDARNIHAFVDEPLPEPADMPKGRYSYDVTYEFAPRLEMDGPRLFLLFVDDQPRFVYASPDGSRTSGAIEVGTPLPLPMPFLRLVPTSIYRQLRIEELYTFERYAPERPVIRVTPTFAGAALDAIWVPLGESRAFGHGDRHFVVSWRSTSRPLGFSLGLYDFHRDFYPGSTQPSSFESYLRLVHPTKFAAGEDIKIDMNHPLRLDGWRLYQARYGNDRTTILQVNRDPGLAIIYPACSVVLLGLIVVLFMKKTLLLVRKKLERDGARPMRHVSHAVAAVAAVGVGPAIFSVYAAIRPFVEHQFGVLLPLSGWPAFVFGLSLVVLCPIMVVVWFTRSLHRKLESAKSGEARSPEA